MKKGKNNTLSNRLEAILRYGSLRIYNTPEEFKSNNTEYPFDIEGWDDTKSIYHFKPYSENEDLDIWEIIQVKPKGQINAFTWLVYVPEEMK